MTFRACTLSSGSNANCTYVEAGDARLLIDAGLSGKAVEERMKEVGACEPGDLDAILVTHEHSDHIRGVGVLGRRYGTPVYVNKGTGRRLGRHIGPRVNLKTFSTGASFGIGEAEVMPFPISHDAAEPVGFIVSHRGRRLVQATDMGVLHPLTRRRFEGADMLVFEANHDQDMLATGPYPEHLKRRISSRLGHLANDTSAQHLDSIIGPDTRAVLLAHLSENNNTPGVALDAVRSQLESTGNTGAEVEVAPRYSPSRWLEAD
jgi:phosphoribosyl 1,2-cyclic phosphodiesterase